MIISQTLIYPIFSSLDIITRITPVDGHKTDITVYIIIYAAYTKYNGKAICLMVEISERLIHETRFSSFCSPSTMGR